VEDVINRIVEIERQCTEDLEKAEHESLEQVEAHKRSLEEKRSREFALILTQGEARMKGAIEEAKKKIEAEATAAAVDNDRLYADVALREAIRERIVSLLLEP